MFLLDMQCAGVGVPDDIPRIITLIIDVIKIAVPVLLIIFGMLDLGKAVMAQKEDEIKKGQQTFIKRLVAAAVVFFVVFIVQIMFNVIAPNDKDNIWSCVNCFVNYDKDKCK